MDLKNSNSFTLQPYRSFSRKFSSEVEKCIMWSSIHVLQNQVSKKLFYMFEDIDIPESHAKLHKKPSELWEQIKLRG